MTVNLLNDEGEVVATTLTNSLGGYRFSVQTELRTGTYSATVTFTLSTTDP